MKPYLLFLFTLLFFVVESSAQRGKRSSPKKKEVTLLKNICCNFVSDRCLSLETKKAIQKDSYLFAKEVKETIDKEGTLNENFLQELTHRIYDLMVFIRLNNSLELQELNSLAIRKEHLEKNYKTRIEVETSKSFDDWKFKYIFSFKEDEKWIEKSWEVLIVYCEYDFTVLKKGNHTIPNKIKLTISENAALEINQNCQ